MIAVQHNESIVCAYYSEDIISAKLFKNILNLCSANMPLCSLSLKFKIFTGAWQILLSKKKNATHSRRNFSSSSNNNAYKLHKLLHKMHLISSIKNL